MKWLIILGLVFVLWAFVAIRYRRQLQTAIYVWKMFRKMREAGNAPEKQIEKPEKISQETLVKCTKCGIWIPQNKAFNLRSRMFYCSANCMESAVRVG